MLEPCMIYKKDGPVKLDCGTFTTKVVEKSEVESYISAGWSDSPSQCLVDKPDAVVEEKSQYRLDMEEKARALGVSFNARTSDEVLSSRIGQAEG